MTSSSILEVQRSEWPETLISSLIDSGEGSIGRPYLESALRPQQLEVFLARAVETAQNTQCLEHEWRELQQAFAYLTYAWEKGQLLFWEDVEKTITSPLLTHKSAASLSLHG
jgi:hypothetical protein